jgi:hypothetical protein
MSNLNEDKLLLQSMSGDMQVMVERIMFLEATLGKLIDGLASIGILQVEGGSDEALKEEPSKESLIITP